MPAAAPLHSSPARAEDERVGPVTIARLQLTGLILASALITFDGTATTVALPAIGREFSAPMVRLQWILNAPLLALAALLLPAGVLADRYGRARVMRLGLAVFSAASIACAAAPSDIWIVAARFIQGAGGALVLPACLAVLRSAYTDTAERTRIFGVWAAWTGAASVAGPLLAGVFVDVWSWRAVFLPSTAAGLAAWLLVGREVPTGQATRAASVPAFATAGLAMALGALATFLMHAPAVGLSTWLAWPASLALAGTVMLLRDRQRDVLFPRELLSARNCVPANATTFAFYFGLFGLSFLLVLYVQQVLRFTAVWAAVVLLPMSMMLLLAERFGRFTKAVGTRWVIVTGAVAGAAGIGWMAAGSHPLPFWSHIVAGSALFGLGVSLAVSALTNAAVAAVPEACAGAASGLNHAVVRAGGLIAVALLGAIAAPGVSDGIAPEGFRRALIVCAAVVAAGGLWGSFAIRDDEPGGLTGGS